MKLNSFYLFSDQYAADDYALSFSKNPFDDDLVFCYSGLSDDLIDDSYEKTVQYLFRKNRIDSFKEIMDHCDQSYQIIQSTKRLEKNTRVYEDWF